jgi:hypothetical protein
MSISSLSNAAAARRSDFQKFDPAPKGISEIAAASAEHPADNSNNIPAVSKGANSVNTALNVLFGYIPTEVLTLYVAVLSVLTQSNKESSGNTGWILFLCFLVATPIIVWLAYGAKVKAANKPIPLTFKAWPIWEMFAATLAYFAWVLALPNNPFINNSWYSPGVAGIAVLIVSTVLGLLAPFFQYKLEV